MKDNNHSLKAFSGSGKGKDREIVLKFIRKTIEKATNQTIGQLQKRESQERLYYTGLKYVTTTNKAICEALGIAVEFGTRAKRKFEKNGLLRASVKKKICPYTGHKAHFLTTDPEIVFVELSKDFDE